MADDSESLEDERQTELSSIAAIFPEIVLDPQDPYSASIDLPVVPSEPLPVRRESAKATVGSSVGTGQARETHYLSHLPDLRLEITLPKGYPASRAPNFRLSTSPSWLSGAILRRLKADGRRLWEDLGHDQVVYAYIDHLQQASESAFGVLGNRECLQVSDNLIISLLDYDINARRAAFEKETFECGVCLDPKKGTVCHRMIDCGHVFCRQCLQDFYNSAITEGNIIAVQCLTPDCAKNRTANSRASGKKRKVRTNINPSELLEIPLEHEIVKRYVRLKHKAELESDQNTIYCPRSWCQGAARSRKHRKPTSLLEPLEPLESSESGDSDSEGEHDAAATTVYKPGRDKLSICEDCAFAFCNKCSQGWHGAFTPCRTQIKESQPSKEDLASAEYVRLYTTPCPSCSAPAQKTRGCNHMICSRCHTHFCYICSSWLDPRNPYSHFNTYTSGCHMRLWDLDGDGDDARFRFRRAWEPPEPGADGADEADEADGADGAAAADDDGNVPRDEPAQVTREGPLVLRIGRLPPPAPRGGPPAPLGPAAAAQRPNQPVAAPQEAAHRAWVQQFVQMALNDEEDLLDWDSDDEEDVGAWDIPVR